MSKNLFSEAKLEGLWIEFPIGSFGEQQMYELEQTLFEVPFVADNLLKLDCKPGENFIKSFFEDFALEAPEQLLEIKCSGGTEWMITQGLPPVAIRTYDSNPLI